MSAFISFIIIIYYIINSSIIFLFNFCTLPETHLEPSRTATMKLFCEDSSRLKEVNYFHKNSMEDVRLCSINTSLYPLVVLESKKCKKKKPSAKCKNATFTFPHISLD